MDEINFINQSDSRSLGQWAQPPANGHRCKFTGLTHGRFYQLLKTAGDRIRTVSLIEEGRSRGTRLVHVPSLLAYINSRATGGNTGVASK